MTPPPVTITEGFARAEIFAGGGDLNYARSEAETLLEEFEDYSGMVAAFLASGTGEVRARLNALRLLQLGGLHDATELSGTHILRHPVFTRHKNMHLRTPAKAPVNRASIPFVQTE